MLFSLSNKNLVFEKRIILNLYIYIYYSNNVKKILNIYNANGYKSNIYKANLYKNKVNKNYSRKGYCYANRILNIK